MSDYPPPYPGMERSAQALPVASAPSGYPSVQGGMQPFPGGPPPPGGFQGGPPPQQFQGGPPPPQQFQGGPPPPGGFQGGPPPPQQFQGGAPPPQQVVTTQVVVAAQPQNFGPQPVTMTCPNCQAQITTAVQDSGTSEKGLIVAGILCFLGCWCCAPLPFCMENYQNKRHTCPNCKSQVGMHKPKL